MSLNKWDRVASEILDEVIFTRNATLDEVIDLIREASDYRRTQLFTWDLSQDDARTVETELELLNLMRSAFKNMKWEEEEEDK